MSENQFALVADLELRLDAPRADDRATVTPEINLQDAPATADQAPVVVDRDLRLDAPRAKDHRAARLFLATLAALAIDLGVLGIVWKESAFSPAIPPPAQEIPIEIVTEPPPPPPPPPESPAPELKSEEIEKPATDAPRAGKSDHDDDAVAEKEKPAAPPPPPAPATPTPEASPAEAPAPEAPKAVEAELPTPVKSATPQQPAPAKSPTVADVLAKAMEPPPDLEYGGQAIDSPVTGGNAKSTYLTKLYGLIVPKLRVPAVAHAYGRKLTGAVSFSVDGRGRLRQRFVSSGSGSMELDEAAMEAVGEASRAFPPPPRGAPIGMTFTYTVN
jgi:periplasmic protein TonB